VETQYHEIRELVRRVRTRWRRLTVLHATARAASACSAVLAAALVLATLTGRSPLALVVLAVVALAALVAALAWGFRPARTAPSDTRVARFIEEQEPSLEDRLVSAVHVGGTHGPAPASSLAGIMIADASRRAAAVDPAAIVPGNRLRRSGYLAAAAVVLLAALALASRGTGRQAYDALSLALFPSRITLDVTPGNARVRAGTPVTIEARLIGNSAPVAAYVQQADSESADTLDPEQWPSVEMTSGSESRFVLPLDAVRTSFRYRVVAGGASSQVFEIQVVSPPRVNRIEVEYTYARALRLPSRIERDGGDIYAPAGTGIQVRVHADQDLSNGAMRLAGGGAVALTPQSERVLAGSFTLAKDDSYRIALESRDGLANPGETEYFIRALEDRVPEVRILRPARDRSVTRLEEVDVEASAEDDFGIERLELVYAVRGGAETVVPLAVPANATSVTGAGTIYLEDLDVEPGDFVSYYVRARDVARGKRASVSRSDIFFLEVKPFEQEFALAKSQEAGTSSPGSQSLNDLVSAQKEIIVATWKLDRRTQAAEGARSPQDIRAVARAEAELKRRVEQTSSSFRESTMRDPRRPRPPRGGDSTPGESGALGAGQTLSEEDAMAAAAAAMGRAVDSLDALNTGAALPPEMEALNHLLKAQSDVQRRQVMQQQASSGGGNRSTQDLSSLFDRELQLQQQTNYETPAATPERESDAAEMIDKVKELARRQDELADGQRDLARRRSGMPDEEFKRELERLTREQSELRQQAEEMARDMAGESQSQQGRGGSQAQEGQRAQQGSRGGQNQRDRSGGGDNARRMQDATEAMRTATAALQRQDPEQARASAARALEQLDQLQRQLNAQTPNEQRRALGDMQLEARELADAQRRVGEERGKAGSGESAQDTLRRLAGEQERLADRVQRLQDGLEQQAEAGGQGGPAEREADGQQKTGEAARDAAQEMARQRLAERMQQSADQMRAAGEQQGGEGETGSGRDPSPRPSPPPGPDAAREQTEIARALDKIADTLARANGPADETDQKLSDQLARAQELRERLDALAREREKMAPAAGERGGSPDGRPSPGFASRSGQGQAGGAEGGGVERLQEEYRRQLEQARELLEQARRDNPTIPQSGQGFTLEGEGMVLSAPGTEWFKQDFSEWDQLRAQVTQALERLESDIARRLESSRARDRLSGGADDRPPSGYQEQVDSYFKALAGTKKP
jgi:hypothetical protein